MVVVAVSVEVEVEVAELLPWELVTSAWDHPLLNASVAEVEVNANSLNRASGAHRDTNIRARPVMSWASPDPDPATATPIHRARAITGLIAIAASAQLAVFQNQERVLPESSPAAVMGMTPTSR